MPDLLQVSNLHAGYGETVILEGIQLRLEPSQTIAVLGRNGVGKTTLLASIMGHTTQHAGDIFFKGSNLGSMPVYERNRLGIGYVPQAREIFPSLTVQENLQVAQRPGKWNLEGIYDLFPNLAQRREHLGNQLSGGEQQMLAIGRALMGNPELILLDEPMEGLAPIIVDGLINAIERLVKLSSMAMVLVEQSARLALDITQNAIVLDRGKIVYSGSSEELRADHEKLSTLFMANEH